MLTSSNSVQVLIFGSLFGKKVHFPHPQVYDGIAKYFWEV